MQKVIISAMGCKNQNCLIRFRGNTRCSLELFFCVTLKVHVILLCANTWWPEKIFCIAHFCSSTSTFFLKCHFWFPGIFKVFGKTDVDNRIIAATIKKTFFGKRDSKLEDERFEWEKMTTEDSLRGQFWVASQFYHQAIDCNSVTRL